MEIVQNLLRAVLLVFSICPFFFFEEKQETQEILPTFETKEVAKYLERLPFQYLRAKTENLEIKRNDPKTVWKYRTRSPSIRMALIEC